MNRQPAGSATLNGRVILLATDGSPSASAATRAADAISEHCRARVQAVAVLDTRPAPMPPPLDLAIRIAGEAVGPGVHAEQERAIRRGLSDALGHDVKWDVRLALGAPAVTIVREAQRVDAALIIMGLRRHSRADRVLHDETTLNVIRTAPCPVLGVTETGGELPKRTLAAMDFTAASISAASVARDITAPDGRMTLAYVPPLILDSLDDGEGTIHALGVEAGFMRAQEGLAREHLSIDHVVIHHQRPGSVAELLLECAEGVGASLIATGSGRPSRVDRWLLGSVSTDLIRDGRCSLLVSPPIADTAEWATWTSGGRA